MGILPCAPVVLLGYHRPEMTAQVFQKIREVKPQHLFLVMDGPKPNDDGDADFVAKARAVAAKVDWDCEVHEVFAPTNLGLKKRVSSGLDEVFKHVEEAIIIEDDCLPSTDFFTYATELLQRYRGEESVGMVSGSSRLRGSTVSRYSYDFSTDVRIWGWATWGRTWRKFSDSGDLDRHWSPEQCSEIVGTFSPGARASAMKKMLSEENNLDSWALPFVVHCVAQGYLNPVPARNLVTNIGLGPSSTHTRFESWVAHQELETLDFPLDHPDEIKANPELDRVESAGDAREMWAYPLRHPLDATARVVRYLALLLRQRLGS